MWILTIIAYAIVGLIVGRRTVIEMIKSSKKPYATFTAPGEIALGTIFTTLFWPVVIPVWLLSKYIEGMTGNG